MPGMDHETLPPFGGSTLFLHWTFQPGWTVGVAFLLLGYLTAARAARRHGDPVPRWRIAAFVSGAVLLLATVSSAIDTYAMSVFWIHMVEHLTLIMVIPVLFVLGHPLTALRSAGGPNRRAQIDRLVRTVPVALLTHPVTGLVVYTAVIIGTHLTGFMDAMVRHPQLMTWEQLAYLLAGYLLVLTLVGREPVRWEVPYLLRVVMVLVAMVPDTVVGIVLLQSDHVLFPQMFAMHPAWAPEAVQDQRIAGGLMWAAGDGLMMFIGVAVVLMMITDPVRGRVLGSWVESVRRDTLTEHLARSGTPIDPTDDASLDLDSGEALAAYNAMLTALNKHDG